MKFKKFKYGNHLFFFKSFLRMNKDIKEKTDRFESVRKTDNPTGKQIEDMKGQLIIKEIQPNKMMFNFMYNKENSN